VHFTRIFWLSAVTILLAAGLAVDGYCKAKAVSKKKDCKAKVVVKCDGPLGPHDKKIVNEGDCPQEAEWEVSCGENCCAYAYAKAWKAEDRSYRCKDKLKGLCPDGWTSQGKAADPAACELCSIWPIQENPMVVVDSVDGGVRVMLVGRMIAVSYSLCSLTVELFQHGDTSDVFFLGTVRLIGATREATYRGFNSQNFNYSTNGDSTILTFDFVHPVVITHEGPYDSIGVALTADAASVARGFITFETLADNITPTGDMMTISDQYSHPPAPATYTGVTFSLSNGQSPMLAKVGSPRTAFDGQAITDSICDVESANSDDMPRAADQGAVLCTFLTDDSLVWGFPPDLIIDYDAPVTEAGGLLLDIDGPEVWEISAYLASVPVGATLSLDASDAGNIDAVAVPWSMSIPGGFDRLVIHYSDTTPRDVSLAFDNFYTSSFPPSGQIPTLTEWGMIIFGVLLLGFITWVFLKRRKPVVSVQ
jgi:hypothetical protein